MKSSLSKWSAALLVVLAATLSVPARAQQAPTPLPQVLVENRGVVVAQTLGGKSPKSFGRFARVSTGSVPEAVAIVKALKAKGLVAQVNCVVPLPQPYRGGSSANQMLAPNSHRASVSDREKEMLRLFKRAIFVPNDNRQLGRGVKVVVVDTGGSLPGVESIYDVANDDNDISDMYGHGTHILDTIRAISPATSLGGVKTFSDVGMASDAEIARSIDLAVDAGARIINLSLGRPLMGWPSPVMEGSVGRAVQNGVAVVCAAGNSDADFSQFIPVSYPGTIRVLAADAWRTRAIFSNYPPLGGDAGKVIAAPGWNVYANLPNQGFDAWSGTSMAAPNVCGALAAVMSRNPRMTADQAFARLVATADTCQVYAEEKAPFVNVGRALGHRVANVVLGRVLDATSATRGGISNVDMAGVRLVVKKNGRVVASYVTDRTGYFSVRLPSNVRTGDLLDISYGRPGYVVLTHKVSMGDPVTAIVQPLPLIPVRPDGDVVVTVLNSSIHAYDTFDRSRTPVGAALFPELRFGPGEFDYLDLFGFPGSLTEAPFANIARAWLVGFSGDLEPITSFVMRGWAGEQTLSVDSSYGESEFTDPETGMTFYSRWGQRLRDSGARVIVTRNGQVIADLLPPDDPVNDVAAMQGVTMTGPRWSVARINPQTGVVTPIQTISPPPAVPDDGGGEGPDETPGSR